MAGAIFLLPSTPIENDIDSNIDISIDSGIDHSIRRVVLHHDGRLNAMSRAMWRQLREVFQSIQNDPHVRCVIIQGQGHAFCAGGDISEYPHFRFEREPLRDFHENDVWGGLNAMLQCDVPIVAAICGACMGAGVEIASCCDIRIAAADARFGAPIAKLGFPMAVREAQLVWGAVGDTTARRMLLEAATFSASHMLAHGFLSDVVEADHLAAQALAAARRVAALAPQAARLNKQTLRALTVPPQLPTGFDPYAYACSAEHREGISAFLDKRPPAFARPSHSHNHNLFSALRAAFPADVQRIAIEVADDSASAHDSAPSTTALPCYTWQDVDSLSARMAHWLLSLSLPEGSRIVVQVEKSVEGMLLYLATLRAGHIFVPLNTAYQRAEIEYFVANAEPAVVVCTPENLAWIAPIARAANVGHVVTLGHERNGTLLEYASACSDAPVCVPRQREDVAAIVYTSGTTGRSKGAMLTHGNLHCNALTLNDYWGWQADDVLIHALPIFHVHGLFVAIHAALLGGSRMIWLNKFSPQAVIAALPRASVFMGVPTLYVRLLAQATLTREASRNMRLFISGSAPLLMDTFNAWRERTGHTILERYGMSETIMLTSNPYRADARYGGQSTRRGATVGFALPDVQLRIVNDAHEPLATQAIGHIQVRGPSVFKGYWRMPEKTAEEFTSDGWFKTGDVGQQDESGYISIVGRSKDLIISGGYNIYPAEVESFINTLPGVDESAVVGVPHPDFGEVGVAVIVPRAGALLDAAALLTQLKTQLAHFKVPKHCVVMPELPRNAMGKVQKNVLRAQHHDTFHPVNTGQTRGSAPTV